MQAGDTEIDSCVHSNTSIQEPENSSVLLPRGSSKDLLKTKEGCLKSNMPFRNSFLNSLEGKASTDRKASPALCLFPIFQ